MDGATGMPSRRRGAAVAGIVAGLALTVAVARVGFADVALAAQAWRPALMASPRNARGLAAVATTVQLAGQNQLGIRLARRALTREPMNVAALRTLSLAREQLGDNAGAAQAMYLAAPLGWRDAAVQVWLIKSYSQHGWVGPALQRADALARLDRLPEATFPIFMSALKDDTTRADLAREMADRPFWRALFFYKVLELPGDQMPFVSKLVAELAREGSPVSDDERNIYLTKLIQSGQGPTALAFWRRDQKVGADAPLLWDGGFEHVPQRNTLGSPFGWTLTPESAGVAGIVGAEHGQQLSVASGRDFNGALIGTTAVLQPGQYRVTAQVAGDATATGLRWTVHCQPGGAEEIPVDSGREGTGLTGTFAIPADGHCATVSLTMVMASGDDLGAGQVTVDNVALRRTN